MSGTAKGYHYYLQMKQVKSKSLNDLRNIRHLSGGKQTLVFISLKGENEAHYTMKVEGILITRDEESRAEKAVLTNLLPLH